MSRLWIHLIILHIQQAFEDASGCKYAKVLNMTRLYIQGLHKVLNMCENSTICLNNAWIASEYVLMYLNLSKHGWILLNVPEYTWKCLNKLFWLCQGSQYAPSSYIFDMLLDMFRVLNMPEFWISRDVAITTLLLELMLIY